MVSMLIMNTYITIFIAYLDLDQQRMNHRPIVPVYHVCTVLCICKQKLGSKQPGATQTLPAVL